MSKAEVKLAQVTRDGKLRVRIMASMLASELVKNFKNESIRINLMNEEQERVNFRIENRDTTKGEILLRLQFKNPKQVSIETVSFCACLSFFKYRSWIKFKSLLFKTWRLKQIIS